MKKEKKNDDEIKFKVFFSIFNTRTLCYFYTDKNVFLQNYIRYSSFEAIFIKTLNIHIKLLFYRKWLEFSIKFNE